MGSRGSGSSYGGSSDYGQGLMGHGYGSAAGYGAGMPEQSGSSWGQGQGGTRHGGIRGGMSNRRNRGPKGYTRSDERIREDLCDQLMSFEGGDFSEVEIDVKDGNVTLKGTINNRQAKYQIEELADNIPGVKDVTDNLKVKRESKFSSGRGGMGSFDNDDNEESSHSGSGSGTTTGSRSGGSTTTSRKGAYSS